MDVGGYRITNNEWGGDETGYGNLHSEGGGGKQASPVCPAETTRKEWIPVDVDGADVLLPVLAMDMHLRMRHWGFLETDLQSEAR